MKFFYSARTTVVVLIASFLFLNGCASIKNAPISNEVKAIYTRYESVGFITLKASNNKNTSYQPEVKYALIWDDKAENRRKYSFKVVEPYNKAKNEFNEYIISFKLKPGKYVFREIFAQSGIFPVRGTFEVPLYKKITVPENKIIYFGHVEANIVDRTIDDQLRAGPVTPLIDQAVVGASTGTFVISIQDRFETDTALIRSKYGYLSEAEIENMTLSEWQQPSEEDMR